ncbi:MAG: hypothetical protein HYZ29_05030 [Myxococcales bacterium]|nr:hypothetical protein [Myxococcales bacterium]
MSLRRLLVPALLIATGCSSTTGSVPDEAEDDTGRVGEGVTKLAKAYCAIKIQGIGTRDTESDYLPHVLACENHSAGLEALKAQAIAARSVAYYAMATTGSICNGQGCQVYSCGTQPEAIHYQAVAETAQQYLSHGTTLTYGFYVAGDSKVSGPSCHDVGGATTKYVTFNDGKSGTGVKQTKLGYVGPPGFGQNRGCMSQWGARCLEQAGRDAVGILQFYYGDDIGVVTAPGSCSSPTGSEPTPQPSGGAGGSGGSGGEAPPSSGGSAGAPPAPAGASCQGLCGSPDAVPGSSPACYCDAACEGYGDCCADYSSAC